MFTCWANVPSPGRQDKAAIGCRVRCPQRIYHQAQNKKSAEEGCCANRLTFPYCAYGAGGVGSGLETNAAVPAAPLAASSSITEALGAGSFCFRCGPAPQKTCSSASKVCSTHFAARSRHSAPDRSFRL